MSKSVPQNRPQSPISTHYQTHCITTRIADNLDTVPSDNGAAARGSTGPLAGSKYITMEGGHRVPFIVRWPEVVQAGSRSDQLLCLTDFFASCADILDTKLPSTGAEDSVSFLPALKGEGRAKFRL